MIVPSVISGIITAVVPMALFDLIIEATTFAGSTTLKLVLTISMSMSSTKLIHQAKMILSQRATGEAIMVM